MTDTDKKTKIFEFILTQEYAVGPVTILNQVLPDLSKQDIIELFVQIKKEAPNEAQVNTSPDSESISKNENTKVFLKNGGFKFLDKTVKRKADKERYDFKLSKWQYFVFWPVFIFAALGGFYGVHDFFIQRPKTEVEFQKLKQEVEDIQEQQAKWHISSLDRKADTLEIQTNSHDAILSR